MEKQALEKLLADIKKVRIAVIGDFCLDAYWFIDKSMSEISLETGLPTRPVKKQKYTLGGAGNVVNNLAAIGVSRVYAFGVIGEDIFGREMVNILKSIKVETDGLIIQKERWSTHVFSKPVENDAEQSRIDFGNFNALQEAAASELLKSLEKTIPEVQVVIINQQVIQGIHTDDFRNRLAKLVQKYPKTIFIANSRHYSDSYTGAYRKINDHEAAKLCGIERGPDEIVLLSEAKKSSEELYKKWKKPVIITRGKRGCVVYENGTFTEIPGIQLLTKVDTVGAGDSSLAGTACALAAGRDTVTSATFGGFVASVTIQKLFETGTASPEEILQIGSDPDYIYRPELADDLRQAKYHANTEIEIVTELPSKVKVQYAIFDHDGTISTLRQGWEAIMEPVMIKAILGKSFQNADESLYQKVVKRVMDYIDKTTGYQTLVQMKGLISIVREFGCVPENEILDEFGYKKIYNDELMKLVRSRIAKFENRELSIEDYTMKNAPAFLDKLRKAGVKLYLASGTDQEDTIAEAKALGYAELFEGRIYGSVGDITKEAKKIVLDRIMKDIGQANSKSLIAIGDGPIEIRETHKRGGYTLGIASNEVQRFGLNPVKRSRLVRAGADMVIPDFSQINVILGLFGIK